MKKLILLTLTLPLWTSCRNQTLQPMNYQDSVSVDSLKMMVWSLPFKHKDIVIAQAILETGWFKSKNYQVNNNLFGMRQVYTRATTSDTVINGYSHYSNWRMSVIDYYVKQSSREDIISTNREQYFRYLDNVYSEVGPSYSRQLRSIIDRLGLDNDDPQPVKIIKKQKHKTHKSHKVLQKKKQADAKWIK